MFRPIVPIIDYLVNYDYIAEQLCENRNKPILACNGKCYVAKEIEKTLPITPIDNKSRVPTIDFDKYPVTTVFSCKYTALNFSKLQKLKFIYSKSEEIRNHIEFVFRPPKNLV
jgi:hypothetical protein